MLGFRNQWQYPGRWAAKTLERLGVPFELHETGGAKGAAAKLDAALAAGRPALATVDRQEIGHWHLPAHASGRGGYPIVVHGSDGDRMRIDDRNLAPLTVERERLDAARARVGSYKHRLVVIEPAEITAGTLRAAVRAGLADAAEHLGARSDSFGLPAWRKWARMLTDTRGAKAWPNVFADERGLAGALLSAYQGIEPVGAYGGHLRGLYADFLDEAAALLEAPRLAEAATAYRDVAALWHELAELALPPAVPGVRGAARGARGGARERRRAWRRGPRGGRAGGGADVGAARAARRRAPGRARLRAPRRRGGGDLRGRGGGRGAAHGLRRSLRQPSPSRR